MTPLTDQFGNTIAYLHQKMLIDSTCKIVLGLIVGNCVFGNRAEPVGKFFNNIIRDTQGRIISKLGTNSFSAPVNERDLMTGTWRILMQIKNHVCGWIPEMFTWSDKNLNEVLAIEELQVAHNP
ncbi:MAG: 4-fold beta flower protein [Chitinophagaceae bacterium]